MNDSSEIDSTTLTAIRDFLDHSRAAARFISRGESVLDDEIGRLAAEAISIRLGESVARMDDEFIEANPDLRLRAVKDMRNIVAHQYDIVEHEELWDAFADVLPQVAKSLARLIGEANIEFPEPVGSDEIEDAVWEALVSSDSAHQVTEAIILLGANPLENQRDDGATSRLAQVALAAGMPDPLNVENQEYYRDLARERGLAPNSS